MPRKYSLNKRKDFEYLFRFGKKRKTPVCMIIYFQRDLKFIDFARFGIVVSKKVSPKAVIRNKIKRQIRTIISQNLNKANPQFDYIIIPYKDFLDKDYTAKTNHILQNL